MNITLLTYGSRGDVQPYLALAVGLREAGQAVTLAGPQRFGPWVEAHGVNFAPLPGDPEEISARFNEAGQNPVGTVRAISDYIFQIAPQVAEAAVSACSQADLILHGFLFTSGGHAIACQQGIPDISIQTFPMFAPTRAFPNVSVTKIPAGWLSYISHRVFDLVFRYGGNSGYRRIRRKHPGLPLPEKLPWTFSPTAGRPMTRLLFAFSPTVLPPPREWRDKPHIHTIGFLQMAEEGEPRGELVDFLGRGKAPVCISFGSMINRRLEGIRPMVLEALHETRQRAVLLSGWGGWIAAEAANDETLVSEAAPYDWLFPRCRLIIHHGGAGTTASALRSGTPSMVIPLAGDQPFWARRVDSLGVGPHSMDLGEITVERLVNALRESEAEGYGRRAGEVGSALRAEDGVGAAVEVVEQVMAEWREGGFGNLKK